MNGKSLYFVAGPIIGLTLVLTSAMTLHAEEVAFDRPGISFAPSTLAAGTASWEQGIPDMSRDRADGIETTQYSADTLLRFGLAEHIEMQLGAPTFVYQKTRDDKAGMHTQQHGAGDSSVALKIALPSARDNFSWALLTGVSLTTGSAAFRDDADVMHLGMTAAGDLTDNQSLAFYVNVDSAQGEQTWMLSPNWGFSVSDRVSLYIEAGYSRDPNGQTQQLAGAGITFMVTERVQLDSFFLKGLTADSPDIQAGLGISVYFP